jgi:hypothetical protein
MQKTALHMLCANSPGAKHNERRGSPLVIRPFGLPLLHVVGLVLLPMMKSSNDDDQKNEKDKDETYRIDAASIYARHANSSL